MAELRSWYIVMRMVHGSLAFTFNLVTIICVLKFPKLRSPSNILVTGLAASDFLHGLTFLTLFPVRVFYMKWPEFEYICKSLVAIEGILVNIQFSMISLLSIERFCSVKSQLGHGQKLSRFWAVMLAMLCWIIMITWVLTGTFLSEVSEETPCVTSYYLPRGFLIAGVVIFIITTLITFFFYSRIGGMVLRSRSQVNPAFLNTSQIQRRKNEILVTKMIGMVVLIFFILYCPLYTMLLVVSSNSTPQTELLLYLSVVSYDINFWINPVIYAWRDKNFRLAFRSLFKRCIRQRQAPRDNFMLQVIGGGGLQNPGHQAKTRINDRENLPSSSCVMEPRSPVTRNA